MCEDGQREKKRYDNGSNAMIILRGERKVKEIRRNKKNSKENRVKHMEHFLIANRVQYIKSERNKERKEIGVRKTDSEQW